MNIETAIKDEYQILAKVWGRDHIHVLLEGEEIGEYFFELQLGSCKNKYNSGSGNSSSKHLS